MHFGQVNGPDGTSSGNTFDFNSAHKDGVLDAYDANGELNTWTNNDFGTCDLD